MHVKDHWNKNISSLRPHFNQIVNHLQKPLTVLCTISRNTHMPLSIHRIVHTDECSHDSGVDFVFTPEEVQDARSIFPFSVCGRDGGAPTGWWSHGGFAF